MFSSNHEIGTHFYIENACDDGKIVPHFFVFLASQSGEEELRGIHAKAESRHYLVIKAIAARITSGIFVTYIIYFFGCHSSILFV
jgi:hypothetical protein